MNFGGCDRGMGSPPSLGLTYVWVILSSKTKVMRTFLLELV